MLDTSTLVCHQENMLTSLWLKYLIGMTIVTRWSLFASCRVRAFNDNVSSAGRTGGLRMAQSDVLRGLLTCFRVTTAELSIYDIKNIIRI